MKRRVCNKVKKERGVGFPALHVRTWLWIICWLIMTQPAFGQVEGVKVGDKVKINAPQLAAGPFTGIVTAATGEELEIIKADQSITVPWVSIEELAVSTGSKHNAGRGTLIGAGTGGMLLGIITMASNNSSGSSCSEYDTWCMDFDLFTNGEAFLIGATAGVLLGGLTGLIIGSETRTDRWRHVPLDMSVGMMPLKYSESAQAPGLTLRVSL